MNLFLLQQKTNQGRETVLRQNSLIVAAIAAIVLVATPAAAENAAVEAMQGYMEFAPYEAGIIVPQQIAKDIFESVEFIDTRDAAQFAKGTIPGARHIEWREVLSRIDEIPTDKKVILFCNTGSLSAQAAFALRVAGRENVLVLQTGLEGGASTPPTSHSNRSKTATQLEASHEDALRPQRPAVWHGAGL